MFIFKLYFYNILQSILLSLVQNLENLFNAVILSENSEGLKHRKHGVLEITQL